MAFGKGKSVGMKRAKKQTVPEAETVAGELNTIEEVAPVEQQPHRRKSAKLATPPPSPVKARVPPSLNKIKMNAFAACAREIKMQAKWKASALKNMEKEHLVKQRLFYIKVNKIGKLGSRKVNPITPRQELNRLAMAERGWFQDVLKLHVMRWHAAMADACGKDAKIDWLEEKLRRMSRQQHRAKGKRSGVLGSPIARFKFMSRM